MYKTIYNYISIYSQSNNEAKKQELMRQEKADLAITMAEMGFRLERQDAQIREMTRVLADLGKFVNPNLCSLMMLFCVIMFCLKSLHNFCLPFIRNISHILPKSE